MQYEGNQRFIYAQFVYYSIKILISISHIQYIRMNEALENGMCDVIKKRLKRGDEMRSKIKALPKIW